ncbi:MAG: NAD-dependent dehydratase [Candidatus Marinimicrobia bacterium]|mgnify:CR=1 FL=1|nr:NAD-dependent dehydratase [Candidatus Neomarinimicrobiota bacterium]|tara:strand:+ start:11112 stop:12089 length:978 start_codon:yes stop_codon:yes gene_type:complete
MNSLITGGAGFIGSHVVDKLLDLGHEIIVLDNFSTGRPQNLDHVKNNINLVQCDISQPGEWQHLFQNMDYIFHLAALADIVPSIEKPDYYYRSNVNGTFNVLEASKINNVKKIIYSASSSCYGIPDEYPTKETAEIRPQYPYALTKYLGEQLVMHWCQVYELSSISLRFFNVYGTRSRTSGTYGAVFGVFLAQKLAGKPFTVVGDGAQTRDFTFVSDIVNAIITAVQSDVSGEIINIGSDNTYSVNNLIELLGGEAMYIPKRPGEPDCTWADISKAKKLLNWQPKVSLEEGVAILLDNIDYWREAPVWDKESIATATEKWFEYLS